MRGRAVGSVFLVAALLPALTTFVHDDHLQVTGAESSSGALGVTGPMTAEQPVGTVGVTSVCSEQGAVPTIRSVEPLGRDDTLEVLRFTIVPTDADEGMEGFVRKPADDQGPIRHRVTTSCAEIGSRTSWLYVEIARPTTATASFHGLRITSGTGRRHDVDFSLTVCRDRCPEGAEDL